MSVVWVDGALREREHATVSIDDLGLMYGAACFETMRAFGGVVFRLEQHLARLEGGFAALGLRAPAREAIRHAIEETLHANGLREARIRLTVTPGRGVGRPDLGSAERPTVIVVAEPAPGVLAPARVIVASQRVDPARPLAGAKTTSYLVSLVALAEARAAGGDEALLLDPAGDVAEAATANVFLVTSGEVITPVLASGALPGVTREAVIECAHGLDVPLHEGRVTRVMLEQADEAFLTNSIVGVRAAASVAPWWTPKGEVPGPVTIALHEAYDALVRRECGLETPRT